MQTNADMQTHLKLRQAVLLHVWLLLKISAHRSIAACPSKRKSSKFLKTEESIRSRSASGSEQKRGTDGHSASAPVYQGTIRSILQKQQTQQDQQVWARCGEKRWTVDEQLMNSWWTVDEQGMSPVCRQLQPIQAFCVHNVRFWVLHLGAAKWTYRPNPWSIGICEGKLSSTAYTEPCYNVQDPGLPLCDHQRTLFPLPLFLPRGVQSLVEVVWFVCDLLRA